MREYDLIIVGGGISGMTAALSAFENGVKDILIIERERALGGVVNYLIHNGFGRSILKGEVTGPEYINFLRKRLKEFNLTTKKESEVIDVSKDRIVTYVNSKDGVTKVLGKSILFATGCRERSTGSINIPINSYTGVCSVGNAHRVINLEGYLIGKNPVIVARDKWALILARRLHIEGALIKGILIQENKDFIFNQEIATIIQDFDLPLYFNNKVIEIFGEDRINGVKIKNEEDGKELILSCDSLILSIGYFPENKLPLKLKMEVNSQSYGLEVDNYKTNCQGIFACGNLLLGKKALNAVDVNGVEAGREVAKYLKEIIL